MKGSVSLDLTDRLLVMVFTRGHCHSLAFAVHTLIGGIPVIAVEKSGPYTNPVHMGVRMGDSIIDIEGVHTVTDFVERWGDLVATTKSEFTDQWEDDFQVPLDVPFAANIAGALVKFHRVNLSIPPHPGGPA